MFARILVSGSGELVARFGADRPPAKLGEIKLLETRHHAVERELPFRLPRAATPRAAANCGPSDEVEHGRGERRRSVGFDQQAVDAALDELRNAADARRDDRQVPRPWPRARRSDWLRIARGARRDRSTRAAPGHRIARRGTAPARPSPRSSTSRSQRRVAAVRRRPRGTRCRVVFRSTSARGGDERVVTFFRPQVGHRHDAPNRPVWQSRRGERRAVDAVRDGANLRRRQRLRGGAARRPPPSWRRRHGPLGTPAAGTAS